jgi:hypothetical protein
MGSHAQGGGVIVSHFAGPQTRFGLAVAAVVCLLDQASKVYLLFVFDLAANGPIRLGPFIDIVLARERPTHRAVCGIDHRRGDR